MLQQICERLKFLKSFVLEVSLEGLSLLKAGTESL